MNKWLEVHIIWLVAPEPTIQLADIPTGPITTSASSFNNFCDFVCNIALLSVPFFQLFEQTTITAHSWEANQGNKQHVHVQPKKYSFFIIQYLWLRDFHEVGNVVAYCDMPIEVRGKRS